MKRIMLAATTSLVILLPSLVSAQGGTLVYRPELRTYVWVAPVPAPAQKTVIKQPLTPSDTIAVHQAMAIGLRANPNARAGTVAAVSHCDRLVAEAREALRKSF